MPNLLKTYSGQFVVCYRVSAVLTQMTVFAPLDDMRLCTELKIVLAVFACSSAKPP